MFKTMNNIKLILVMSIILSISCNKSITTNFYDQTINQATKQQKLILLDFTANWCGGCRSYDKYIFNNNRLKNKILNKFIILKVDRDKPENKFLVHKYNISGLPHIVLIDNNEKILGSILGFKKEYINNPDLFISHLDEITISQKKIRELETIFYSDTTNEKIINNLIKEYDKVGQYIGIPKMKKVLIGINPTQERLFEYNFDKAIYSIRKEMNPNPLISILCENDSLDGGRLRQANSKLLYYYESIGDVQNQDYYYQKLMKGDPEYYQIHYARFLFEHNIKIDSAIILTNKILLNEQMRNDHWGQFLNAHLLVYQEKKTQAINEYYNWMDQHEKYWQSGENFWMLYFYARFANYHNVDLERALDFIKISEGKRNILDEKLLMAEILYKLGKTKYSIDKLTDALQYTKNQYQYNSILNSIEKYKVNSK